MAIVFRRSILILMSLNFMKQFDNLKIDDFMNSSYIIIWDFLLAPGPFARPRRRLFGTSFPYISQTTINHSRLKSGLNRQCRKSHGEGRTSTYHSFGYLRFGVHYDDDASWGLGYSLAKPLRLLRHYDNDHHYLYSTLGLWGALSKPWSFDQASFDP